MEESITHEATVSENAHRWFDSVLHPSKGNILIACITVSLAASFSVVAVRTYPRRIYSAFLAFSLLFVVVTLIQQVARRRTPATKPTEESNSRLALLPALIAGVLTYAWTLSLYFVCDDFDMLAIGHSGFLKGFLPFLTRGQLDGQGHPLFYRPLGFAS